MRSGSEDALTVLRARVESQERELRGALADLGGAAYGSIELARWVRGHPWAWVAGALVLGFWLGARD